VKAIIISDIHLRAYFRYNKFPDQRLLSFLELARDIVEVGKKQDSKTLIITGDIIDKSTLTPKEIHILFQMFTILAEWFKVYSIVGNHDMRLKKGEFEREDSIVTLLEEIEGVRFLHQEVIHLHGRALAFENWMPEFKLDWTNMPIDVYFSHATIDYDEAGFYGMDTSVFEGKFTLGFFGDIHVRRELGNLISVGNTKQESLSDRYQGGGVILNLEDLSWERFSIDPEHKKYLHLEITDDMEEEGWEDLEGDSMVYKIFRPAKVVGKNVQFTLPKISDINETIQEIMKEVNLLELHQSIKSQTNYQPIDFNFALEKLTVTNFRSIKHYELDFDNDYVITGHNGSGKSTLITALYYALVGKKTLKQDITFGEKTCTLELQLTYQNQRYVITRGTGTGDYGLTINGQVQKYNSKLEFERDVFQHLPFLLYTDTFIFNYWDTELLSSVKLDRRFDIISKYFRLDALSDYNDVGNIELKKAKKDWKDLNATIGTKNALYEAKKLDLEGLENQLSGVQSEEYLRKQVDEYDKKKILLKEVQALEIEIGLTKNKLDVIKTNLTNSQFTYDSNLKDLEGALPREQVEKELEDYITRSNLTIRIDKGETLTTQLQSEIYLIKSGIDNSKYTLGLIDPGEAKVLDPALELKVKSIRKEFFDKLEEAKTFYLRTSLELKSHLDRRKEILRLLEEAEKPSNCVTCKRPLSNEDNITLLNSQLEAINETIPKIEADDINFSKAYTHLDTIDRVEMETAVEIIENQINEIRSHNAEVTKASSKIKEVNDSIEVETRKLKEKQESWDKYSKAIEGLKTERETLPLISEAQNTFNSITISKYDRLEDSAINLRKYQDEFDLEGKVISTKLDELELVIKGIYQQLEIYTVTEQDNLTASLLLSRYDDLKLLKLQVATFERDLNEGMIELAELESKVTDLETYCELTSRSGEVLKKTLDELTKTFSNSQFRFTTDRSQASGKVVTDMSIEYLVGKTWVSYPALSSGQKTLCDLYFISQVITGVGVVVLDETLRFLDDSNLVIASDLISSIKKRNLLLSTHSPNLYMEGITVLSCALDHTSCTTITSM
jgi:ABC-type molybdenum transport system ATPase subunit/photorepair protein PhrA/UDP-2,3-diacylglucosamine pyrophosphatase LpxH